ncbi:MAG TPA: hypothetical protein VFO73_04105 [Candidatus Limnocylindrales bacterium]|nr:hypothetical protein [Candidatus Limnocylindrales bacterium]
MRPTIGSAVNIGLRAAMVAMLGAVLRAGENDPRYVGKGIGTRFGLFAMPASMLVPVLWALGRRRVARREPAGAEPVGSAPAYPAWMDSAWLSMLALDLLGNVFDLYDRHTHFDLIPHAHGTGVLTVTVAWLLDVPMMRAIGIATALHVLLEAQEVASDVVFGYRNVRGVWDEVGDLSAGAVGSVVYAAAYQRFVRDAGREPVSPLA